jgi:isoamylase
MKALHSVFAFLFTLGALGPALAQDGDLDGVPDALDAFACDPSAAGAAFAPADGSHGMLQFEDQWPSYGDNDFNDVVLTYSYALRTDAQGRAVGLQATFNVLALGGDFTHGLGLHLPVPAAAVRKVERRAGGLSQALTPSTADAELVVEVSSNLRELFGFAAGPINSVVGQPTLPKATVEVWVDFVLPVPLFAAAAPYDVFIFRVEDPGHEVHRPEFMGTARMNAALFNTANDASDGVRNFVDDTGLPYALLLPQPTDYPKEGTPISSLFPDVVTFAASGGTQKADFYVSTVVASAAYAPAEAPAFLAGPACEDRSSGFYPWGMGAVCNADCSEVTFKVFSQSATRMEVWLYAAAFGQPQAARVNMTRLPGDDVWFAHLDAAALASYGLSSPLFYGYRAWGPNWSYDPAWTPGSQLGFVADVDAAGNRFNPNKLLLDPYALEMSHDPIQPLHQDGTTFASGPAYRGLDSGLAAPKGVVLPVDTTSVGTRPTRNLKDDVVYEVHVRGLTMNDASVPASLRGTYAGAAYKAASLAALGVTAVELLPVQETQNDGNDLDPVSTTGDNYWGYMTLSYFAPDRRYAADKSPGGPTREFKAMVKAFHDAGLKVFVDVVYNHTGEGGVWGTDNRVMNVLSFRGLDNQRYYSLTADRQWPWDNTGVGGNFNTYDPAGRAVILDSLAYFAEHLGVDGFRFDLASVLGNTCLHGCFNYDKLAPNTALNQIAFRFPARPASGGAGVDLIAEPWAIGGNSYQVGGFPAGWAEWNGLYRDTLRKDQNGLGVDPIAPSALAARFAGSSDLYQDDGRKPFHSVNFMVAHDGLTLRDLYACNGKNNLQPWPYGPSDGGEDNNHSWDQGGNAADQRRAARNGLAFLALSAGVPMITGGDEHLRTQYCNNNVYNLDSVANWLDYGLDSTQQDFRTFTQRMLAFRAAHPALHPAEFYSANDTNGNVLEQLRWFTPAGVPPDAGYWGDTNNHALAWRYDGTEFGDSASAIYVAYNGWSGQVNFTLPWPGPNKTWYRVTDTCNWAEGPSQVALPGFEAFIGGEYTQYGVCGRGLILLIAK